MKKMHFCNWFHVNNVIAKRMWPRVLVLLLFSLLMSSNIIGPAAVLADSGQPEISAEVQAQARALQLEGTSLQLKGDLQGAIEKYRQSQELKPNPSLERLTGTLKRQIERKQASEAAGQGTGGTAVSQPEVATSQSPEIQRSPASPQEDLIYTFTDWLLGLFPAKSAEQEFGLLTNHNYTITPMGAVYEVRLDPFVIHFGESELLDLSPAIFKYKPQDNVFLEVELILPGQAPLKEDDEVVALMRIGDQTITGTWSRNMENFVQSNVNLTRISIEDVEETGKLVIGMLQFGNHFGEAEKGNWKEEYRGGISDVMLDVDEEDVSFAIQDLSVLYNLGGKDLARYVELRKKIYSGMTDIEDEEDIKEFEALFMNIDEYLQLFTSSQTTFSLTGMELLAEDDEVILDSIAMGFQMNKDPKTGKYLAVNKGDLWNFSYHGVSDTDEFESEGHEPEANTDEGDGKEGPPQSSFELEHAYFSDSADIDVIPPTLFKDLFTVLMQAETVEDQDAYAAEQGIRYVKMIFDLFDGYSGTIGLEGLVVEEGGAAPISLADVVFSGGFHGDAEKGRSVTSAIRFSGFEGLDMGGDAIPKAGGLRLELTGIPSLMEVIPDASQLAGATEEQIQNAISMKAMGAIMSSSMALTMRDTFVTFPMSKLNLGLVAKVNGAAKMFSTGSVQLAVENPDDLMRIMQFHGADENVQRMLATLTALANRTTENGTVIDRLDMQLNEEGRIYSNNKDVTPLFFPEQPQPPAE